MLQESNFGETGEGERARSDLCEGERRNEGEVGRAGERGVVKDNDLGRPWDEVPRMGVFKDNNVLADQDPRMVAMEARAPADQDPRIGVVKSNDLSPGVWANEDPRMGVVEDSNLGPWGVRFLADQDPRMDKGSAMDVAAVLERKRAVVEDMIPADPLEREREKDVEDMIPADPLLAETHYSQYEDFESDDDESEEDKVESDLIVACELL